MERVGFRLKNIKIVIICCLILTFITGCNENTKNFKNFKKNFENSNKFIVVFEDNNGSEEKLGKVLIQNDVDYVSININELKDKDIEYVKNALGINKFSEYCGAVVENQKTIKKIYLREIDKFDEERIKALLAEYDLIDNSKEFYNEYYYQRAKKALDQGFIGSAKSYLSVVDKDYKDTKDLLNDKRFFLLNEYHYDYSDGIRTMTFQYLSTDKIFFDSFVGQESNQKAYVINDTIYICRSYCESANPYKRAILHIDYVNENELKFKEWNFVLKKVS